MKHLLLFLTFLFALSAQSQNLNIDGVISGYNYSPLKGLFNKGSDILLDGKLKSAKITVYSGSSIITSDETDNKGEYSLSIPTGKWYTVEVTKKDFKKIVFNLDLTHAKEDINFWSLELILNSHIPKKSKEVVPFGLLGYNSKGFYFKEADFSSKAFSKSIDYTPLVSLIKKSITKNHENVFVNKKTGSSGNNDGNYYTSYDGSNTDSISINSNQLNSDIITNSYVYTNLINKINKNEDVDILEKEKTILDAKKQLEIDKVNAKTGLDSLLIHDRELIIIAAENEVEQLKQIINQKEEAISLKNRQLWMFFGFLILFIILIFFILRANTVKSKLNHELGVKNKKINDSITYAEKIQSAILPQLSDFEKFLPNSFILYKPKDKVSGDYYWFEEVNDKIIIAAVDCTGHGVPGAFMSMIGNTLMNNIILERNITNPKDILNTLNKRLQKVLNQDSTDPFASQDGMDLSICVIDKKKNTVTYAGAMNCLYLVKNGEIEILEVDKRGIGGFDVYNNGDFSEHTISIEKNTKLYMLSDGFQDQFGGNDSEKYNLTRFKELLLNCESKTANIQKELIDKSLTDWQLDHEQTDDILIIGISL